LALYQCNTEGENSIKYSLFTFRPAAVGAGDAVAFGAQGVALAFGALLVDRLVVALVLVFFSIVLPTFVVDLGERRADGAAARERDVLAAAEAEEEENSAEGSTETETPEQEEAEEEDNLAVEPENSELESETATDGAIQPRIIKPMAHRGSGKDITDRVNTTKPDVYVLKDGKKIYVLKNGKVQLYDEDGKPSAHGKPRLIKEWEDVVFEYKWNIPHQEHNPLQIGDWFTIDLPALKDLHIKALNFDKNKDYNIDWYNGETKKLEVLGSFRVDTDAQKLTAKLNKNGASKYAITDGFFRLKFRAEETLEVTPGEKGTTGINIEKPNNPGGNKPTGKDKLKPGQGFHKGGYVMYVLLLCSIFVVAIAAERARVCWVPAAPHRGRCRSRNPPRGRTLHLSS